MLPHVADYHARILSSRFPQCGPYHVGYVFNRGEYAVVCRTVHGVTVLLDDDAVLVFKGIREALVRDEA